MSAPAAVPPARHAVALRALAHPLRWALVEVLLAEQTATATRCAELVGEPVNSCSFHLRMLAKYGYIERVEESDRRERPWRLVEQEVAWDAADDDQALAADALDEMLIERESARQREFLRTRKDLPRSWRHAASARGRYRWMTAAELESLNHEIDALYERFADRHDPSTRPRGARLVRMISVAIPLPPLDAAPTKRKQPGAPPGVPDSPSVR
ncbi:MAG: helix-turn-helix domain-containing protein [Acidimicrobiia bacterium]